LANISFTAHIVDIFSLAITDKQILSTSGASSIKVHSTTDADFPLVQSIDGAHTIGCHHIVTNGNGSRAITAGFDGEIKAWSCQDGHWTADRKLTGKHYPSLITHRCNGPNIKAQRTSQVPMPGP
jgi:superkiller protein 8